MIFTRNNQRPQVGKGFQEAFTYLLDPGVVATKVDINVRTEIVAETGALLNGPIVAQFTESDQHVFEDPFNTEQFLELGFWSRPVVTPVTGLRIRVADGIVLPGLVDIVLLG